MDETQNGPRRFKSAARLYEEYRLTYPQRLIGRVIALLGLKAGDAVLDLGCGPGSLAIPFARAGLAVTAMDPEPEMLDAARVGAKAAGVSLTLVRGGSCDLTPAMGPFRLAALGRAFHWMDRAATLAMLDRIVTPDGAVALFHDAHPPVEENDWFKVLCEVTRRFRRSMAPHEGPAGGHRRYEPYLFASAFTQLDGLSVTVRHALTLDQIVGRAFSMSLSSPEALGGRAEEFEARLRAALRKATPDGKFIEIAELVAVIARRAS